MRTQTGSIKLSTIGVITLWLGLAVTGLYQGAQYEGTPSQAQYIHSDWPQTSNLTLGKNEFTVVLFAHPACPCTGATLHQLAEAEARSTRKPTTYIVFSSPADFPSEAGSASLRKQAQAIPGARVLDDRGAKTAGLFKATTSGQCFVFDSTGKQVFQGGLTKARGHYGSSQGSKSILELLNSGTSNTDKAPTFGCALNN